MEAAAITGFCAWQQDLLGSVQRAQGGAAPPPADRLEVFPEPGFVVKTANEQGQKVFINVCGSAKMPLPPGWARGGAVPPEVKQHLEGDQSGDAPPAMRFPMSMGAARIDVDHKGVPCLVLDCILSTNLLAACAEYRPLKLFLIQLALGMAAQQTGLELDPQYRLPKMRYKGEGGPPPQFIRVAPEGAAGAPGATAEGAAGGSGPATAGSAAGGTPLIKEVPAGGEEEEDGAPAFALLASKRQQRQSLAAAAAQRKQGQQSPAPAEAAPPPAAASSPQPRQQEGQQGQAEGLQQLQPRIEYEGKPATAVCISVPLPPPAAVTAARQPASVQASVCAETVRLRVPGCQPLEVRLPFAVTAAGATAQVASEGKGGGTEASLLLRLPYRPFSSVLTELRQAAAAAEGPGGTLLAGAGGSGSGP
ncbi:hypothetical protein ABPG75_009470 [Micractinium tetrahymenae]